MPYGKNASEHNFLQYQPYVCGFNETVIVNATGKKLPGNGTFITVERNRTKVAHEIKIESSQKQKKPK